MLRAVLDTNVLLSALRSRHGASHELMRLLRARRWKLVLSNTVLAEYEEVLKREASSLGLALPEIDRFPDALCLLAEQCHPSGGWGRCLPTRMMRHSPISPPMCGRMRSRLSMSAISSPPATVASR